MKIKLFYILIIFLLSFGPTNSEVQDNKKKTSRKITLDTSSIKEPSSTINDNVGCEYDNEVSSLGIGLIISPSKFTLYNDSLLTDRFVSKDMYSDNKEKINLCSKFYEPEYGIMHFVCLDKTKKSFKVLVNYSDIKYLPNTEHYKFKSWNDYIIHSFGIRRLHNKAGGIQSYLPLRKEPNEKSDTLAIPKGYEMFCPLEIKGDWIKVKYDCFYNQESNPHEGEPCHGYIDECNNPLTGWLRWRQDNKLLIDIFLMP